MSGQVWDATHDHPRRSRAAALATALVAWLVIGGGPEALAQDVDPDAEYVPEEVIADVTGLAEINDDFGWDLYLRTGLSGSLTASSNVIGSVDGNSWTLGGTLHFGWYYLTRRHEWRNDLRTSQAFSRSPIVDDWVKSSDTLEYLSMYFYRLPQARWMGPFARLRLNTPVFTGLDVRPEPVTYNIARLDGTTDEVTNDRLRLTDPFRPLTLRETVGVFFSPTTPPYAHFEALVGFGARQTFADDQLAVTDDEDTAVIEVTELQSFSQAGTEIILNFWGELDEGRFAYAADAEFMTPFINDAAEADDRSAFELTNVDFKVTLSLRPYSWLSVDYQFRAMREPQLLDEFQITNQLLVGIAYTLIERSIEVD